MAHLKIKPLTEADVAVQSFDDKARKPCVDVTIHTDPNGCLTITIDFPRLTGQARKDARNVIFVSENEEMMAEKCVAEII
jgi:hypothetical protein